MSDPTRVIQLIGHREPTQKQMLGYAAVRVEQLEHQLEHMGTTLTAALEIPPEEVGTLMWSDLIARVRDLVASARARVTPDPQRTE